MTEVQYITANDGETLNFSDNIRLIAFSGYGSPSINYITRKYSRQHGATEVGYTLESRSIMLKIWKGEACSRQEYWDFRNNFIRFFHPEKAPLTLSVFVPEIGIRSIEFWPNPGFMFPPVEDNSWNVEESIEITCPDPIWFDPNTQEFSGGTQINPTEHVFPETYPIVYHSVEVILDIGPFVYEGTWKTYPTIFIQGPYSSLTLANQVSGSTISLITPITSMESRTIVLTPGNQQVYNESGQDRMGEVDPESDIIDFAIFPDPEAADGINHIEITAFDVEFGLTSISITITNRYYGI